ncbi:MAG TPA: hypothetical protein VMU37_00150 [Caulobacteraceae bacterium]|nr:hypothetical protein [Caulobacteraceae bacterium]
MRFSAEGLVLGLGTVLARRNGASLAIDPTEPRLQALLTAAHLDEPTSIAMAHLRRAAECWSHGDEPLASMHLVLSRVDRLARPEADAQRLFLADRLMSAGCEPSAVIGAILGGDTAIMRLQKQYDPDQPRVPAGSGRASGQWTSGDDGASPSGNDSSSGDGGARSDEVNPSTVTQVVSHLTPCDKAQIDCIDAAVYASRNDAANDNSRFLDIKNCKDAGFACDALSWATEDLPLPLSGGVIFPHNGIVLIQKGLPDRYLPPLPNGRRPPIRRSMESALATPPQAAPDVDGFSYPPPGGSPGETALPSDAVGFSACRRVLNALSSRMNGKITNQTCSESKQWGNIVRAKINYEREGSSGTACVTCWSGSGRGVQVAMTLNCC